MAIKDIGKFTCKHKRKHKSVRVITCEWCGEDFERPSCWPKDAKFCSSWCARRYYQKNYSGENHPNWKHGRTSNGYKRVGSFGNRKLEHRVIMENILGRKLNKDEWVHHINGINDDNRPENLMVVMVNNHHTVINCPHCGNTFGIK